MKILLIYSNSMVKMNLLNLQSRFEHCHNHRLCNKVLGKHHQESIEVLLEEGYPFRSFPKGKQFVLAAKSVTLYNYIL